MCFCLSISREKLYDRNYVPDNIIEINKEGADINEDYESIVTLLGTIYLQEMGGQ